MKKKIQFTTPWCQLRDDPRFADPVYFDTEGDYASDFRPFFCSDGLNQWNIPKGAEVRLHITNYKVKGAQKRIYTAGNLMTALNTLAVIVDLEPRSTVWWWPEVRN